MRRSDSYHIVPYISRSLLKLKYRNANDVKRQPKVTVCGCTRTRLKPYCRNRD